MTDLSKALAELGKKYPDTPILTGKELEERKLERISTGSVWLDYCLDGGLPRGRVVEIFGPPSSGKTLVALRTIAEAQKNDLDCVFIDAEQAFDPDHAKKLGVDVNKLVVIAESGGERAINIALKILETKPAVLVVDSVASLVPEVEEEEGIEKQTMALQARLMSKAMRKLTGPVSRSNTLMIFINQIREKVGAYGNPETTSGGKALGFYASVRLEIRRGGFIKLSEADITTLDDPSAEEKKRKIGQIINFKIVKSKVSQPHQTGSFEYYYKGVVNEADELISLLEYTRNIERRGSYYYVGKESYQGRSALAKEIRGDKKLKNKLIKLIQKSTNE